MPKGLVIAAANAPMIILNTPPPLLSLIPLSRDFLGQFHTEIYGQTLLKILREKMA